MQTLHELNEHERRRSELLSQTRELLSNDRITALPLSTLREQRGEGGIFVGIHGEAPRPSGRLQLPPREFSHRDPDGAASLITPRTYDSSAPGSAVSSDGYSANVTPSSRDTSCTPLSPWVSADNNTTRPGRLSEIQFSKRRQQQQHLQLFPQLESGELRTSRADLSRKGAFAPRALHNDENRESNSDAVSFLKLRPHKRMPLSQRTLQGPWGGEEDDETVGDDEQLARLLARGRQVLGGGGRRGGFPQQEGDVDRMTMAERKGAAPFISGVYSKIFLDDAEDQLSRWQAALETSTHSEDLDDSTHHPRNTCSLSVPPPPKPDTRSCGYGYGFFSFFTNCDSQCRHAEDHPQYRRGY